MTNTPFQLTARPTDSVRSLQPVVFAFGRLGDMVMLSPALNLLHQRFGRRCLVVGAGTWNSALFQGHVDVERVLSFPRHIPFMLSSAWWQLLIALQQAGPGPVYVCERSPRQLARIRRMLAVTAIDPQRCLFVGDVAAEAEHWVDSYVRLSNLTPAAIESRPGWCAIGPSMSGKSAAPRLHVSEAERQEGDAWLQARGWFGRPLVLLQPGNFRTMSKRRDEWRRLNKDDKAWPIESWVALSHRMLGTLPDARVVVCGAPQEGGLLREIAASAGTPHIAAAELGLRQLMALSEAAHSMISVDTGPAHVAAALDLPLVVLFGSESQHVWLPRSPSGSPVLGLGGPPLRNRVDQIPVNEVFDAWCSLTP